MVNEASGARRALYFGKNESRRQVVPARSRGANPLPLILPFFILVPAYPTPLYFALLYLVAEE